MELECRPSRLEVTGRHDARREVLGYLDDHEVLGVTKTLIGLVLIGSEELPVESWVLLQRFLEFLATFDGPTIKRGRLVMIDDRNLHLVGIGIKIPVGVKINTTVQQRNNENEDEAELGASFETPKLELYESDESSQHALSPGAVIGMGIFRRSVVFGFFVGRGIGLGVDLRFGVFFLSFERNLCHLWGFRVARITVDILVAMNVLDRMGTVVGRQFDVEGSGRRHVVVHCRGDDGRVVELGEL